MKHVIVLGGGIAGLTTAYFFSKRFKVTLIEKSPRLGGWVRSIHQDGFLFECGPRGFRPAGKGLQTLNLLKALELEPIAASKHAKKRYLVQKGQLCAVTGWLLLKHGWLQGCLRDLLQKPKQRCDETLAAFFTRHFGTSFTHTLIDPLTRGIFGGDYRQLSARCCAPQLWQLDQTYGSLLLGKLRQRQPKPVASLFSFQDGMETLITRLAQTPMEVRLNTSITGIESHCVHLEQQTLHADVIISALPASALCPLLGLHDPHEYATISTVNFGWDQQVLPKQGYGFLVPSYEPESIMGMTWDSCIFPEQAGATRICTMLAGSAPKLELIAKAREAVQRLCHIDQEPQSIHVATAYQAIAQYGLDHFDWLKKLYEHLPQGVYALGSSLNGVGINDCIDAAAHLYAKIGG